VSDRDELLRLIEADLDGEIGADERARLETALRDDPALAAEAAELRRLRDVFRSVPPESAPAGFKDAVLASTVGADAAAEQARSGFHVLPAAPWIAGLAAAALLVVMLGPWWGEGDGMSQRRAMETADAPEAVEPERALDELLDSREAMPRARKQAQPPATESARRPAPAKSVATRPAPAEAAEAVDAADAGEAEDDTVALGTRAPEERIGGRGRADGPPAPTAPAEPPPAPRTTTATAPTTPGVAPGAKAKDRGVGKSVPTEQPAPVDEPVAEAPAPAQTPGALGGVTEAPADRLRSEQGLVQAARRYVVFEDEAAARRFLASLKPAPEKKAEADTPGAESDGVAADTKRRGLTDRSREGADSGPTTGGGAAGAGPATGGGGGGAGAGATFARAAAPRVLGRVTLATTDATVGRALARAPQGGAFGEAVPADLLEVAELRAKAELRSASRERPRGSQEDLQREAETAAEKATGEKATGENGGDEVVPEPEEAADADEPDTAGGEPAKPSGPRTAAEPMADARRLREAPAQIEIVVVIVPPGTLPARSGAGSGGGR
jgi:hypothetical protein